MTVPTRSVSTLPQSRILDWSKMQPGDMVRSVLSLPWTRSGCPAPAHTGKFLPTAAAVQRDWMRLNGEDECKRQEPVRSSLRAWTGTERSPVSTSNLPVHFRRRSKYRSLQVEALVTCNIWLTG